MTTNEFYYLVLVLGAFGAFAVGLSVATIQYHAWLRRPAARVRAGVAPGKQGAHPARVRDFADAA